MKLSQIKPNKDNPREIPEDKLEDLKRSIDSFKEMMEVRPIVVDEKGVILGGNARYMALKALGINEIPDNWVYKASAWSKAQKKEFIIKDNLAFGKWDWTKLMAEWDHKKLEEWGLEVWEESNIDMDDFFKKKEEIQNKLHRIVFEYPDDQYKRVQARLEELGDNKERVLYELLGL